jgi:hypothetical protein
MNTIDNKEEMEEIIVIAPTIRRSNRLKNPITRLDPSKENLRKYTSKHISRKKRKVKNTKRTIKKSKLILPPKKSFKSYEIIPLEEKSEQLLIPPKDKEELNDTSEKSRALHKDLQKHTENIGTLFSLDDSSVSEENSDEQEKEKIDWSQWYSPSQLKNYILKDCFLDMLATKSSTIIKANPDYSNEIGKMIGMSNQTAGFVPNLLNAGNTFESKVIVLLTKEFGEGNVRDIGGNHNSRSDAKYANTLTALEEGVPCIFQAIVRNYENKTYGVADILIRSDWINRFLDVNALSYDEVNIAAPKLNIKELQSHSRRKWNPKTKRFNNHVTKNLVQKKCHYVVIDIKYKSLQLRADGVHLRNDGILKVHKSQVWIYTDALGKMQGYCPPYAFLLGSKWKYTSCGKTFEGSSCFEKLGRVDFKNLDVKWIEKTNKAIVWLDDVRLHGDTWDMSKYPLPRKELYPNMCNSYDYPYRGIKQAFAEAHNDLTLLWYVGPKQRKIAHKKGIYSWKDPRCTPEALGIVGDIRPKVLSRILEANQPNPLSNRNIYPKYVKNNISDWKNFEGRTLELYVDFETTCSVFNDMDELPHHKGIGLIFLIGAGYICPVTKAWVFQEFVVNAITQEEELRICCDFMLFEENLRKSFNIQQPLICYHWAPHETITWRKVFERNNNINQFNNFPLIRKKFSQMRWVDMLKVFKKEPIGVRGCLGYGLKPISKAFYKYGYIKSTWDNGEGIANGTDAAVSAYRTNNECIKNGTSFAKHSLTLDIIKYNEIDCRVLSEIMSYLRIHHIDPNGNEEEDVEEDEEEQDKSKTLKRITGTRKNKKAATKRRKVEDEDEDEEQDDEEEEDDDDEDYV